MLDLKPACLQMIDLLSAVTDEQLDNATPCADYAVRDLIAHVDDVSRGFTSVARKDSDQESADAGAPIDGADWRDLVSKHVRSLGDAWDDPAAWEGNGEIPGLTLSNELWGKIALTELVVHGWDLARATGLPFDLPEQTLLACYDHVAEFVPNAPLPELWGAAVDVPSNAPLLDRIVAITGRTP